jgi:undecaprenyl-diphosphatase
MIGRTLDGGYSFPSGHTAGITAVASAAGLLVVSVASGRPRAATLLAALGVLGATTAMTVALVANRLHFLTDTIAGAGTALAIVLGTAVAFDGLGCHLAGRH